jgi:hypothetical protein
MTPTEREYLRRLHVADRLRVAAALVDDAAAERTPRARALVRVVEILADIVSQLAPEILRADTFNR